MRVAADHLLATLCDPLLDYFYVRSRHDQSAYSMKACIPLQTEFAE
jgi:hypothetical protein